MLFEVEGAVNSEDRLAKMEDIQSVTGIANKKMKPGH